MRASYLRSSSDPQKGSSAVLQRKLTVARPGDSHELEADRIAERVTRMPGPTLQRACACGGECPSCREEQKLQKKPIDSSMDVEEAPEVVHEVLHSSGQPLPPQPRRFMESRFGYDFAGVRVHTDDRAAKSAESVRARAYTVSKDIVFGAGQYAPGTSTGQRLLAHELAHVVQQSHAAPVVQRDEFAGATGTTAKDKDRPLTGYEGPMLPQSTPGGTVVANTAGTSQNCAGDSCSIQKYINWPHLGIEVPGIKTPADWSKAVQFVPTGCTRVNCTGINVHHTRCTDTELELIAFLYKWPVALQLKDGSQVTGTQSDFHMIGRDAGGLPSGWHSKMDRREKVVDIRSPEQSLADAYPHTLQKNRTIQKLCFCCTQSAIKVI
jgi:hypothetical protein